MTLVAFFAGKVEDVEEDNNDEEEEAEADVAAAVKVRNELPPGEESMLASATAPAIAAAYVLPAAPEVAHKTINDGIIIIIVYKAMGQQHAFDGGKCTCVSFPLHLNPNLNPKILSYH